MVIAKGALADLNAVISKNPNVRVVLKDYPILNEKLYELSQLSIAAGFKENISNITLNYLINLEE